MIIYNAKTSIYLICLIVIIIHKPIMSINSSFLHATHIVHHLEMEYNYFKDKYLYENKFTYVIP